MKKLLMICIVLSISELAISSAPNPFSPFAGVYKVLNCKCTSSYASDSQCTMTQIEVNNLSDNSVEIVRVWDNGYFVTPLDTFTRIKDGGYERQKLETQLLNGSMAQAVRTYEVGFTGANSFQTIATDIIANTGTGLTFEETNKQHTATVGSSQWTCKMNIQKK